MSTIVASAKNGIAWIGADTMIKWGHTRETGDLIDNNEKLGLFGETWIASVGHASTQLILKNYFLGRKPHAKFNSVEEIFETFRQMHRVLKDDYYMVPDEEDEDPFESTRFNLLLANPTGIYGMFSLRTVQKFTKFFAFGSGAEFALGAMNATFDSAESAEQVIQAGLTAAAQFDDATAAPFSKQSIKLAS